MGAGKIQEKQSRVSVLSVGERGKWGQDRDSIWGSWRQLTQLFHKQLRAAEDFK